MKTGDSVLISPQVTGRTDWTEAAVSEIEQSLIAVTMAMNALNKIDWFKKSVRDIRAFRIEDWSDFTLMFKVK